MATADGGGGGRPSHVSYEYRYAHPDLIDGYAEELFLASRQVARFADDTETAARTAQDNTSGETSLALQDQLNFRTFRAQDLGQDLDDYRKAVLEFGQDVRSFRRSLWDVREHAERNGLRLEREAKRIPYPDFTPPTGEEVTQAQQDTYVEGYDAQVRVWWKCHEMREAAREALHTAKLDLRDAVTKYAANDEDHDYDPNRDRYKRRYHPEEPGGPGGNGGGHGGGNRGGPGGGGNGHGNGGGNGGHPGGGRPGEHVIVGPEEPTEKEKRELVERMRRLLTVDKLLGGMAGEDEHNADPDKAVVRWNRDTQSWEFTDRAMRVIEGEMRQADEAMNQAALAADESAAANERNLAANRALEDAYASNDPARVEAAKAEAEAAFAEAQEKEAAKTAAEEHAVHEREEAAQVTRNAEQMLATADSAGDGPGRPTSGASASATGGHSNAIPPTMPTGPR